jgi:hypothetical protein
MVPLFHGHMRAGKRAGTAVASGNAAVEHTHVREGLRRVVRARRDEQHAKTWRLAIVLFLLPGLLATALLIGGHAIIDPVLRAAADAHEASRVDRIVFTMPDVAFCRHLSFNNETAELTEGTARCPEAKPRGQGPVRSTSGFACDRGCALKFHAEYSGLQSHFPVWLASSWRRSRARHPLRSGSGLVAEQLSFGNPVSPFADHVLVS